MADTKRPRGAGAFSVYSPGWATIREWVLGSAAQGADMSPPLHPASVQFCSDIPSTYRRPGSRLWKPEIDGQRLCRRAFLRDEEAHPKRRGALQDAR